jgi:hypothetical protein
MLAARRSGPRCLCHYLYVAPLQTAIAISIYEKMFCPDAGGSAIRPRRLKCPTKSLRSKPLLQCRSCESIFCPEAGGSAIRPRRLPYPLCVARSKFLKGFIEPLFHFAPDATGSPRQSGSPLPRTKMCRTPAQARVPVPHSFDASGKPTIISQAEPLRYGEARYIQTAGVGRKKVVLIEKMNPRWQGLAEN